MQFERLGYFRHDEAGGWNRAVTLKDTWAKIEKKLPAPTRQEIGEESAAEAKEEAKAGEIGIEEFGKVDLRVGLVKEAGLVEGADKLIRVMVDLGEGRDRQIFAGPARELSRSVGARRAGASSSSPT